MASKRKGKEIESFGSGASKKQSTAHNYGIQFKDQEQRNMYNSRKLSLLAGTLMLMLWID